MRIKMCLSAVAGFYGVFSQCQQILVSKTRSSWHQEQGSYTSCPLWSCAVEKVEKPLEEVAAHLPLGGREQPCTMLKNVWLRFSRSLITLSSPYFLLLSFTYLWECNLLKIGVAWLDFHNWQETEVLLFFWCIKIGGIIYVPEKNSFFPNLILK